MKRVLRGVLMGLGALLVLMVLIIGGVFWASDGAAKAADTFFETLARDGTRAAYALTSDEFRRINAQPAFDSVVGRLNLQDFKSAHWDHRSIQPGVTELGGEVTLKDGVVMKMTMQMTQDAAKAWHVDGFNANRPAGPIPQSAVPDQATQTALVRATLGLLADALRRNDFNTLYGAMSGTFREQLTPAQLADGFRSLTAQHADLGDARQAGDLALDPAERGDDGRVTLRGTLTTPQQPWYFRFGYIREAAAWKPIAVGLSTTKP